MRSLHLAFALVATLAACKKNPAGNAAAPGNTTQESSTVQVSPGTIDSSFLYLDGLGFEALLLKNKNIALIDMRSPEAFKAGHLYRSTNVSYANPAAFMSFIDQLSPGQPIALYCENGHDSALAGAAIAQKPGRRKIYILKGGIFSWYNADKPVVTF